MLLNYEIFVRDRYDPRAYFSNLEGTFLIDFGSNPILLHRIRSLPRESESTISVSYRPDLVAYERWNVPRLYWALLIYNGLSLSQWVEGQRYAYFRLTDLDRMLSDYVLEFRRR